MCLHYVISSPVLPFFFLLFSPESIRKVLDKQAIKFVRAIKQDTRSGKTEDRILVRDANTLTPNHHPPLCLLSAVTPGHLKEIFSVKVKASLRVRC